MKERFPEDKECTLTILQSQNLAECLGHDKFIIGQSYLHRNTEVFVVEEFPRLPLEGPDCLPCPDSDWNLTFY